MITVMIMNQYFPTRNLFPQSPGFQNIRQNNLTFAENDNVLAQETKPRRLFHPIASIIASPSG